MRDICNALLLKARQLDDDGQLPQAILCYEELLQSAPEHLEALCCLAEIYAKLNDMPNTILMLSRALALNTADPRLHNNLANAYKKSHDLDKAFHHYLNALQIDPQYAEAHHNLAILYAQLGEIPQAIEHYQITLQISPDFWPAHHHLGLLFLKQNEFEDAMTQFKQVLATHPSHLEAHFYIGVLHLEASQARRCTTSSNSLQEIPSYALRAPSPHVLGEGNKEGSYSEANELLEAEQAFQQVLETNPEHIQAIINLGVISLKREEGQQAIEHFTHALALDNNDQDARNNLAATFMHHDRFENALMHYDVLQKKDPNNIEYLYNMGVAQMALGHLSEASAHFEALLTLQKDHFAALNNLAAIHIRLGQRDKAIVLLQLAVAANPKDEASRFMLSALSPGLSSREACPTYVCNLFNNYALYYDHHMHETLNYALPQIIGHLLHLEHIHHVKNALDLGCGTGLCGSVLKECSEHLTGVDISTKMLAHARQKALYDTLIEDEIHHFLHFDKEKYDLVLVADVLPYLGDLETLFSALRDHMMNQGVFIFTHELSDTSPFQLQETARFSHHPEYIKTLCEKNGFQIVHNEQVIARTQNQQGLPVNLYMTLKR
ncbi:MAG: tetratricopeptide repeat protein [Legionellales bacterium]|nr:tetratricopeptide repeat protein [Legionellales bacterium]